MTDKDEYKVWASNDQGASTDVARNEGFTSQRAAENAARREMGPGWTIHVTKNGEEIKKFRIR
jgi:hypothetical protein